MKALIVEDEQQGADLIKQLLFQNFPSISIVAHARNVEDAVAHFEKYQPELIFLDIEIFGGTGFDVLNRIDHKKCRIIFCTGYDQYAIRAFKYSAADYLLKPISVQDFISSVQRVSETLDQELTIRALIDASKNKEPEYLMLPAKNGLVKVPLDDIIRIVAAGSYSEFEIQSGNGHLASRPIGYFEDFLPDSRFVRIHHSAIVNIRFVKEYDHVLGTLTLENGEEQQISVRRRKLFRELFQKK